MALGAGIKLGPYEIQSLIGAGGMGEVYRAHDARLDRTVAIKVLPISYSADRDRLQRFAQEARSAAALNHPNILSIFDIGENRGAPRYFPSNKSTPERRVPFTRASQRSSAVVKGRQSSNY